MKQNKTKEIIQWVYKGESELRLYRCFFDFQLETSKRKIMA